MAAAESGSGWFHKPLDYDMCAAMLDGEDSKTKKIVSLQFFFLLRVRTLVSAVSQRLHTQPPLTEADGAKAD